MQVHAPGNMSSNNPMSWCGCIIKSAKGPQVLQWFVWLENEVGLLRSSFPKGGASCDLVWKWVGVCSKSLIIKRMCGESTNSVSELGWKWIWFYIGFNWVRLSWSYHPTDGLALYIRGHGHSRVRLSWSMGPNIFLMGWWSGVPLLPLAMLVGTMGSCSGAQHLQQC
jgi:hypothetical protein